MMQRIEILISEATEKNLTPYSREMSIAQPLDLYLANIDDDDDDDDDVDVDDDEEEEGGRLVVRTGFKRRFDRDDGEGQGVGLPPLPPPKRLCRRSPKVYAAKRCVSLCEDDEETTNMTEKVLAFGGGDASFFFRGGATTDESLERENRRFAAARRDDDVDHRSFWGDVLAISPWDACEMNRRDGHEIEVEDDDERSRETTASDWE